MNREQIQATVIDTVATVLQMPANAVAADATRADLPGWDSLKHVEIVFALEDATGVQFGEAEMAGLDGIARIVDVVAQHHAA